MNTLPVWSWSRSAGRRGPALFALLNTNKQTNISNIQVCVIHVFLSVNILCSKTSAPTVTVEQLQFVMNPIVCFFSRRLLNTRKQTDGRVCFQHLFGFCDLCDETNSTRLEMWLKCNDAEI